MSQSPTNAGPVRTAEKPPSSEPMEMSVALAGVQKHSGTILTVDPLTVESSGLQWDYAVSVPLTLADHVQQLGPLALQVRVSLSVDSGTLGCLLVADDWVTQLGTSATVSAGGHTMELLWERGETAHLVFRNHGGDGRPCVFRITAVTIGHAPSDPFTPSRIEDVLAPDGRLEIAKLRSALAGDNPAYADDAEILNRLRRKWNVVPAGLMGRRGTSELESLSDGELRAFWSATHAEATTGAGFSVRGWYHTLYRDVLRGKKVLEIGSGMGIDGIEFARHGAQMTFVDIVEGNLAVMRRLCDAFGIRDAQFLYLERVSALDALDRDYDVVWCQGSLINAPFDFVKRECATIVRHLKAGGRWIELAYPRERWVRDGQPSFRTWGTMTDGEGTPWVEWYDLERVLQRLAPVKFEPVLAMNFHDDDYNWFDLLKVEA